MKNSYITCRYYYEIFLFYVSAKQLEKLLKELNSIIPFKNAIKTSKKQFVQCKLPILTYLPET